MKILNKEQRNSIGSRISELVGIIFNWGFIFIAIAVFALISFSLEQLIGERVWIIFILNLVFCGFFFIAITKEPKCISSKIYRGELPAVYFILIFLIIIIVAATFECFNSLLARLNILILPIMVFSTFLFSINHKFRRKKS
ncbi:MAG: hypothetical protein PHR61_01365 [Candidatus Absconditabacteria bacterium]|nr:hypothetical protein [Candidatus Absconditabacteria bacterium]